MRTVVLGPNRRNARIQHASSSSAAIERGCSIGANHAQNHHVTNCDPAPRVAIARFRIIRAGFDKRSAQAFPNAGHRSITCNRRSQFNYRRGLSRLPGSGRFD
jgi:hypothetical protein